METYRGASVRYLATLLAALKKNRSSREELASQRDTWKRRIDLAAEHGRKDLEEGARTRLEETEARLEELRREEVELMAESDRVRGELRGPMIGEDSGEEAGAAGGPAPEGDEDGSRDGEFDLLNVENELERMKREEGL